MDKIIEQIVEKASEEVNYFPQLEIKKYKNTNWIVSIDRWTVTGSEDLEKALLELLSIIHF